MAQRRRAGQIHQFEMKNLRLKRLKRRQYFSESLTFDILGDRLWGQPPGRWRVLRSLLSFCDLSFLSTHSILLKILQSSKGLNIGITDIFFRILLCQQKALSFTFPGPLAKSWHCWGRVPAWCSCCCRVRICEKGKVWGEEGQLGAQVTGTVHWFSWSYTCWNCWNLPWYVLEIRITSITVYTSYISLPTSPLIKSISSCLLFLSVPRMISIFKSPICLEAAGSFGVFSRALGLRTERQLQPLCRPVPGALEWSALWTRCCGGPGNSCSLAQKEDEGWWKSFFPVVDQGCVRIQILHCTCILYCVTLNLWESLDDSAHLGSGSLHLKPMWRMDLWKWQLSSDAGAHGSNLSVATLLICWLTSKLLTKMLEVVHKMEVFFWWLCCHFTISDCGRVKDGFCARRFVETWRL